MTTSGTSSTLCNVCLVELSLTRREGEKIRTGGVVEKTLKKLNGLRLTCPLKSMVLAKQMGRGATEAFKKPWRSAGPSLFRSTVIFSFPPAMKAHCLPARWSFQGCRAHPLPFQCGHLPVTTVPDNRD